MQAIDMTVRHFIYQTFAKTASPPTASQIAKQFNIPKQEAIDSLERLADAHHIALAPGSHNVWMAHPFSGIKTDFVTRVDGKTYWGNWIWDVFGIAAILDVSAEIHAPCGCDHCEDQLNLSVQPGTPVHSDWRVHFVVPAKSFWDQIGYTWATILPFSSKAHLDDWLARKQLSIGYEISMQTCWQLAQRWYTGRGEKDWQRPDAAATQALFASLGLTGPFWDLGVANAS